MPKFTVMSPLKIAADKVLQPGETVELTEKQAKELIACGAIEAPKSVPPQAEPKKK